MDKKTKKYLIIYGFILLCIDCIIVTIITINGIQINNKLNKLENSLESSTEEISVSVNSEDDVYIPPIEDREVKLVAIDNMSNKIYSNFENINPDFLTTDDNGVPKIGKYLISDLEVAHTSYFASVGDVEYNFCKFENNKFIHYNADNEEFEDVVANNFNAYICFCFEGNKDIVYKKISKDEVEDIFNYKIKYNDFYNTSKYYDESDKLFQLVITYYINS